MNCNFVKHLSILTLLGLVCLAIGAVADPATEAAAATTIVPAIAADSSSTMAFVVVDDDGEEFDSDEDEDEDEEFEEEMFLISLEDSLAQFVIRHRDVRRDCDDIDTDLKVQAQNGAPADTDLQLEYVGCIKYKRELEDIIRDLSVRIGKPGSDEPIELPSLAAPESAPSSGNGGILSSIMNRLPSLPGL